MLFMVERFLFYFKSSAGLVFYLAGMSSRAFFTLHSVLLHMRKQDMRAMHFDMYARYGLYA